MKTWAERITELEASGMSLTQIANDIGTSQQALSELKQGRSKEPRGMAAVRLHELHARICGDDAEAA
jgi:transcriptional regulator with XRE-family HTH domain